MRWTTTTVLLLASLLAPGWSAEGAGGEVRTTRSAGQGGGGGGHSATRGGRGGVGPADRWLRLIADLARSSTASSEDDGDNWFPGPIPVNLPVGRGEGGKPISVPVLLLPVPVPVPSLHHKSSQHCDSSGSKPQTNEDDALGGSFNYDSGDQTRPRPFALSQGEAAAELDAGVRVMQGSGGYKRPRPALRAPRGEEPSVPHLDYVVSSQQLVELFKAQVAPHPELPPALIPDYSAGSVAAPGPDDVDAGVGAHAEGALETQHGNLELEVQHGARLVRGAPDAPAPGTRPRLVRMRRYQLHSPSAPPPAPFASLHSAGGGGTVGTPASPRFDRSLLLRGELTVPRAGYSEPYSVWWDAGSGAARVDLHGGATSTYRTVMPDGRVRFVEMRVERSGGVERRRCATSVPRAPSAEDRAPPALPDLQPFTFAGYVQSEFGTVERWAHTVSGEAGELGGARGEALSFRHELLLARAPDNYTTTPLRYSVSVDSSVLGADCDGYVHRYTELRDQHHEPGLFVLDLVESCEEVQHTTSQERLEPLREFTMSQRDPRYDTVYREFKNSHQRRYVDDTEEAVRKNLLVQHSRFVGSGNRQGATHNLEMNHLGDRLDAELGVLMGVREDVEGPTERFPHSADALRAARGRLPREFDWRTRGAVTHVRNQGSCSSCWAFAVTGAVEGALYVRTRALVPLSEQCLVDCAHPFGGHGCGGTWPSAAYDYIQQRGLPALAEYTPYQEKVLTCVERNVSPVTHISAHVNVTRNNVEALKVAIRRHAPTVVIIDATPKSFIFYKKGVLHDERCAKNKAEHAVLAVGWGVRRGGEEHIILKNSWSEAWGDGGYVRVQARANTCGVLSRPSYPRLERADVDRVPSTSAPAPAPAPDA